MNKGFPPTGERFIYDNKKAPFLKDHFYDPLCRVELILSVVGYLVNFI
jgi:hypothetical protein